MRNQMMRRWRTLTAAPHRTMFLSGMASLLAGSAWWTLHLVARYHGTPPFALATTVAPIWAHAFQMLFTMLPCFVFGFLFTTFPRWMNGPAVPRASYAATGTCLVAATALWLVGLHGRTSLQLAAVALALLGTAVGTIALFRVLLRAQAVVSHAVVCAVALSVGVVSIIGFGWGLAVRSDAALHLAVRSMLWGCLLPVFFAVSHRMVPFFSQGAVPGYAVWRPTWALTAFVAAAYLRLLLGIAGRLEALVFVDLAMCMLAAWCCTRWTSLRSGGKPLLWTLYVALAWLPIALLMQALRDASFVLYGEWALGRAPIHALTMGYFGGMLVAMVTRVTMGHSGRPLAMDRIALAAFFAVQVAAIARVSGEITTAPGAIVASMLAAAVLWLLGVALWTGRHGPIYLLPRRDGRPG